MGVPVDHARVVRALREQVQRILHTSLAAASAAYDEATHAESKAENKYDTRGLEASYLAAGQAVRIASLRRVAAFMDQLGEQVLNHDVPVGLGCLVALQDADDVVRWSFVAPDGGGISVQVDGVEVRLITRDSPLGEALVGAVEGDSVELTHPRPHELTVVRVTASV